MGNAVPSFFLLDCYYKNIAIETVEYRYTKIINQANFCHVQRLLPQFSKQSSIIQADARQ